METNVHCITESSGFRKLYQLSHHDLFFPAESKWFSLYQLGHCDYSICTSWIATIQSVAIGPQQFSLYQIPSVPVATLQFEPYQVGQNSMCTIEITQIHLYLLGHDSLCTSCVTKTQTVPNVSLQFGPYLYQSGREHD